MEPLVSVICITRNHERYCIEALNSVFNQTYKNIEWIILDAASTDGTVKLIDNWLVKNNVNAVFLKEKVLKPVTVNLNKALTFTKGGYVQFLSLDDVLLTNKLEDQVNWMERNRSYGMVFSDAIILDENSHEIYDAYKGLDNVKYELFNNLDFFQLFSESTRIIAPTTFYRKDVFEELGFFDENLSIEDWEMYLRISKSQWKIKYQKTQTAYYRVVSNSLSRYIKPVFIIDILKTLKKYNLIDGNKKIFKYFNENLNMTSENRLRVLYYILRDGNKFLLICGLFFYFNFFISERNKVVKFLYKL